MRKVPEIEQKLNELVTLSVRLGDSSHHAQSVTRVLDLKKDWSALKSQVTQHSNALKVWEVKYWAFMYINLGFVNRNLLLPSLKVLPTQLFSCYYSINLSM